MIETLVVVMVIGLVFAGLVQLAMVFTGREILHHAAARAARARTVGFNRWMVRKAARVGAIPNAGRILRPEVERTDTALADQVASSSPGAVWDYAMQAAPESPQAAVEAARIPEYLASENDVRAAYILDYEDWDTIGIDIPAGPSSPILETSARQSYPLRFPMHRAFYAEDDVPLEGRAAIENHYPLYIDDMGY